jgi:hypothetical protein
MGPGAGREYRVASGAADGDGLGLRTVAADHRRADLESGALARFRRDASVQTREALGRQWMAFVAASMADDRRHDP